MMDLDQARAILTDPHLTDVGSPLQLAVTAVLDALDAGEVATEWAARWPTDALHGPDADHDDPYEAHDDRPNAEWTVKLFRADGVELVSREVRRGPWTAVTS